MKIIKKIFIFIIITFSFGNMYYVNAVTDISFTKEKITQFQGNRSELTISDNSITIEKVLKFFKDSIFGLLSVIAIGAFIFIGIRLFVAKGNPDEFKKAMMHFVYAVLGIFIVSSAWVVIKFVVGIDI